MTSRQRWNGIASHDHVVPAALTPSGVHPPRCPRCGGPCLFVGEVGDVFDQPSVRGAGACDGGIALVFGAVHERIIAGET
jgi:hypothetical protein